MAGKMRWTELTPAEWRAAADQRVADLKSIGTFEPYEKEYRKKDGSRVPALVGGALFGGRGDEGVAFVIDLTDRKRAEKAAQENERRYQQVQMELAHANRVASMGQLSASIAHEVSQPITGAVTNAHAALRALDAEPPNIETAQRALARIVRDGNRAGEVVGRVRALSKKAPTRKDNLDIDEAILEVVGLTQGEAAKHGIAVRMRLADNLPCIEGDRVQLQQVVLNLIINAIEAINAVPEGSRELLISAVRANSNGVLVAIQDSGPGVDPVNLDHIFDAFYSTKPGGLGMGLSVCRAIIDAHGGTLWASSGTPRGAIFQFTLPARTESVS